jgi:sugar/nucleoside kinase (ribokinase family)
MDVACLGILVADIFASPIDSLPREGELKATDRFWMSVGGCAANTAVDLRRLNRHVAVMGRVGADIFGNFVIDELGRHSIETSHVKRSPSLATSSTVIVNVRGQDRRYIHCIGANAEFGFADVDLSCLEECRVLYVGGYLATPGLPVGDLAGLFKAAKKKSVTTVLDVVIPAGASVSLAQVTPVLPHTDYFLPNEDEARLLTGESAVAEQLKCLASLNPACTVVITRGEHGSVAKCGTVLIETTPFPVEAIDESGAGDAFAAGLITGVLESWPLDYMLSFASAVGACCTRALGCHDGVPCFDEAQKMISERGHYVQKTG